MIDRPGPTSAKIAAAHLQRLAIVYVRQSSPQQVRTNPESQANQRALVERALALGWHRERVRTLDADLGQSASTVEGRDDFKALAAEVALGHVGIIFGWEVSRLARNNADWYHLLDLATLVGTLIADVEGIYDPRLYNDRLLLGLQGTMSEAELHMMRQRLDAGRLSKVLRGDYVQHLPTGLVRQADGRAAKDPDAQVRHTIELVFATFAELGSCQRTVRFLRRREILLPRHQTSGFHKGELLWRKPSAAAVLEMLNNPAYAGAFAYGRRPTDPTRRLPGRHATGHVRKPMAAWVCLRQGAYPAYIPWEQFLANQARLRDHATRYPDQHGPGRGAAREGAALLQGMATCGICGHAMRVIYRGGPRYLCDGLTREFGEPRGVTVNGGAGEAAVVRAFFAAIQPAQLDALQGLLEGRRDERRRLARYWEEQVQRATYEVHLARRRYEAGDPANRRVAGELERRWEEGWVQLRATREAAERAQQEPDLPALSEAMRRQLEHVAQCLPELWTSGALTHAHRKLLLRRLIARVILTRTVPDRVEVKIVWVSGHFSVDEVTVPIHRQGDLGAYPALVARGHDLWAGGHTDAEIAAVLGREGFHSARSRGLPQATVLALRERHGWVSRYHRHRLADQIDGRWTIHGLSRELGVDRNWFYRRIYQGKLREPDLVRTVPYGNYLIRNDPELIARLRRQAHAAHRASQSRQREPAG